MSISLPGYSQVWDDPSRVTCVPGAATTSKCKILVITTLDPADNVFVVVNGVIYTGVPSGASGNQFNMSALNYDGPATVGWSGLVEPSGLDPFTRYSWSVSQKSGGSTFTDNGSFMTAPESGDDFQIVFASCDNTTNLSDIQNREASQHGIWPEYKRLAEQADPPVAALFFVDDYGYVDNHNGDDTYGITGLSFYNGGLETKPSQVAPPPFGTAAEYNYALGWISLLGMTGGDETNLSGYGHKLWGKAHERAWCRKNLNLYFQWGDHEFVNDIGWDNGAPTGMNVGDTVPTQMCKTAVGVQDGAGYVVFERLFGLIRPDPADYISGWTSTDTVAKHWCAKLGDALLVAPDFITNCDGNYIGPATPDGLTATTVYGTNQIDDVLGMIDTVRAPFNLFGMAAGLRYPQSTGGVSDYPTGSIQEYADGTQHPLYDHKRTEFDQLISADNNVGYPSIMDNPYSNGAYGTTVFFHGDYHRAHVYRLSRPASAWAHPNVHDEVLYSIGVGTVNGSVNFFPATEGVASTLNNYIDIEMVGPSFKENLYPNGKTHWGLIAKVIGSNTPKKMQVTVIDENYQSLWSKWFGQFRGNHAYDSIEDAGTGVGSGGVL